MQADRQQPPIVSFKDATLFCFIYIKGVIFWKGFCFVPFYPTPQFQKPDSLLLTSEEDVY